MKSAELELRLSNLGNKRTKRMRSFSRDFYSVLDLAFGPARAYLFGFAPLLLLMLLLVEGVALSGSMPYFQGV